MNCFQLIQQVLDTAYRRIPGTDEEKVEKVDRRLEELDDLYKDLTTYKKIDYGDPVTRVSYIYKYVTSHANLVAEVIEESPELCDLLTSGDVHVACIGGGPGSDMLGIVKIMDKLGAEGQLACTVLDAESAWGDSWSGIFRKAKLDGRLTIFPAFQTFDVTDPKSYEKFDSVWEADLFTFVYFMSEVYGLKEDAEKFFMHLFERTKPGAYFLFVDNQKEVFPAWFDDLATRAGLEIVDSDEGRRILPSEEQRSDLGEFFKKFSVDPKVQTWIAARIARKP